MSDRRWQAQRLRVIAEQGRCCYTKGCLKGARDVVAHEGHWRAFCVSCRLKLDAKLRVARAAETRKFRAAQITIDQYLEKQERLDG